MSGMVKLDPSRYSSHWRMRYGLEVIVRPICPEDEPLMVKFHQTLSDRTVYFRYFCSLSLRSRVAHERLARICFADHEREFVLVAEHQDAQSGDRKILAVGRLNKLENGQEAEIAILVSDEYQKRGLGQEMLRRLIQIARDERLARVYGELIRDNFAMQKLLREFGFHCRLLKDPGFIRATLDL
ncbi:MAG TPA: GNAT family N-acetyltransferase [Terriglobales bacterium]|nr:GNAT family N-acetyltransferase [Terriglobales bacterium]